MERINFILSVDSDGKITVKNTMLYIMENVPQVHADQNKADFDNWCNFLRSKGYINHWQDLNAKDYGIPQNRDRCFMVSILSDNCTLPCANNCICSGIVCGKLFFGINASASTSFSFFAMFSDFL